MKNLLFKGLLIVAISASMIACEAENDFGDFEGDVSTETVEKFKILYPSATSVVWRKVERKVGSYDVANFSTPVTRATSTPQETKDAWFSGNSEFVREDTEFDDLTELPQVIQDGFAATEYSNTDLWEVDDIEFQVNADEQHIDVYVIEVEVRVLPINEEGVEIDEVEYELFFNVEGVLIAERLNSDEESEDDDMPVELPQEIIDYLATNYPNAQIIDSEIEDDGYEVEILFEGKTIEIEFDLQFNVTEISKDVTYNDLPENVRAKIMFHYPNLNIETDEIEVEYEEANGVKTYEIELEIGEEEEYEIEVILDAESNITSMKGEMSYTYLSQAVKDDVVAQYPTIVDLDADEIEVEYVIGGGKTTYMLEFEIEDVDGEDVEVDLTLVITDEA